VLVALGGGSAVLFEEWAKLRAAGVPTPQIAVWANIPSYSAQNVTATLWKFYLDRLYASSTYQKLGLVFTDEYRGKPVFNNKITSPLL
jgi:hypothetical protein